MGKEMTNDQAYEMTNRIVSYFKAMNPKLEFPRMEYEFDICSIIKDERDKNIKKEKKIMPDNHRKSIEIMVRKIKEAETEEATCNDRMDSFVRNMRETQDRRDEIREVIKCLRRSILDLKGLDNIRASNEKRKEE